MRKSQLNQRSKSTKILSLVLGLGGILFLGAVCTKSNTNVTNFNVQANTNIVASTNQNINLAANTNSPEVDTSDWNRVNFDDLGFSILFPFEESSISRNYTECDKQSACDEYGYSYSASLAVSGDSYTIVRSVSKNWSPSRRAFFGEIYDMDVENNTYKVILPTNKSFDIQPIDSLNTEGVQFYLFDSYDYYSKSQVVIDGEVEFQEGSPKTQYAAIFLLPNNEKYKAALITFKVRDMSLEQLRASIESIKFF